MPRRKNRWTERVDARLGHTIDDLFLKLPPHAARELFERVHDEAAAAGVPITVRPRIIRAEQAAYFQKVCLDLGRAIERLAKLYLEDDRVRALLPFTEREARWLREVWRPSGHQPQTVLARLDANADLADDAWNDGFHVFAMTPAGAGGMYDAPRVSEILMRVVVPAMQRVAPALAVKPQDDTRQLLIDQLASHARAIRRPRVNTAFIHARHAPLVELARAQGVSAVLADPRELYARGGELYARVAGGDDLPIDVVYRDGAMSTFIELEDAGADLAGLKHAFLRNQVVSSIAGELDHQSAFEVFTSPELAPHFTMRQQRIFRHHVLWTRIVRDVVTTDPDGAPIDLLPWLRRNKERLVLKPNRGRGIVVGPHVDLADWDAALQEAMAPGAAETGGVVAQRHVDVRVKDFPVLGADGRVSLEELYVVCGVLATERGVGILGRASKKRAIDIRQNGGLTGVLVLV